MQMFIFSIAAFCVQLLLVNHFCCAFLIKLMLSLPLIKF